MRVAKEEEMSMLNTSKLKANLNALLYEKVTQELLNKISSLTKENDFLQEENDLLKDELKENMQLMNSIVCKYTPYMVSDAIYDIFNVRLSSRAIVNIASDNGLFESHFFALRIPRKKDSNEKTASTVTFSIMGISCLLPFLIKKYSLLPNQKKQTADDMFASIERAKGK